MEPFIGVFISMNSSVVERDVVPPLPSIEISVLIPLAVYGNLLICWFAELSGF